MPTVVAIASVIVNKNEKDFYDIYVVSNNLSHESIALLKKLDTEYVLFMIDDFFLIEEVDQKRINDCIKWMDEDKEI